MSLSSTPGLLGCLALISFVAGAAKGLTGFGGALVMAPLFSLLIGVPKTGVLVVLVHCATSLQGARSWASHATWRLIAPLASIAVLCAALCTRLMIAADANALRHLVACAVLGVTALHMAGWRWRHDGGWLPTAVAGATSGALTALGGLGGPPALYYFSGFARGAVLRANLLGYFALLFGGATALLALERRIDSTDLGVCALLIPAFVTGVALGERCGNRLPPLWFDRAVNALLLGSGLVALLT